MARVRSSLVTGLAAAMGSTEDFVVVELTKDGPRPVYDADGQLMKFASGEDASRVAREMTVVGKKFQPRRVKDDKWHEREKERFATKEYQQLPWHDAVWWKNHRRIWGDHYPHVSKRNSVGLMAYTPSDAEGSADSQVPIKPGRYLERYFASILDPVIIKDLCTVFSNVFEDNCLLFADSEDDFESLYTSGPSSCMSHPKDKYTSHIHPVRVYAAGDLQLVYMKRDGRVVARALCWPEKKTYSRVYGDAGRLEPLLAKEGYKKGTPYGARLQRILTWENKAKKSGNQAFVAPHIDDCTFVLDNDDHLLIGGGNVSKPGKTVKLTGASGVTEWVFLRCACGKEATGSELVNVYIDKRGTPQRWCPDCVKTKSFRCAQSGSIVSNECAVEMYDGAKWWDRIFIERGFKCAGSGKNYPSSTAMHIMLAGQMATVSKIWYREAGGATCNTCGNMAVGCNAACKTKQEEVRAEQKRMEAKYAKQYDLGNTSTIAYTGNTSGQWLEMPLPPVRNR